MSTALEEGRSGIGYLVDKLTFLVQRVKSSIARSFRWKLAESIILLMMVILLLRNRLELGRTFLFRYSDEDQTLLWYASNDLSHGRIPEPCFYGQSYNSCLEGYLATPLVMTQVI